MSSRYRRSAGKVKPGKPVGVVFRHIGDKDGKTVVGRRPKLACPSKSQFVHVHAGVGSSGLDSGNGAVSEGGGDLELNDEGLADLFGDAGIETEEPGHPEENGGQTVSIPDSQKYIGLEYFFL